VFSVIGLILVTVHPLAFAIVTNAPEAFIPKFDSWIVFWNLAGRPALYLIYISVIAVLIRKKISQNIWRILHGLNYVALVFGYFHGVLIGTDFQNLGIMITFTAMFVISMEVLIYRRYQKYIFNQKKKGV
jgi:predicted ferric reductase